MLKNYLKTAWRNIWKNKLYAVINIAGLAIGLTACLLIGVYILHELSYDKFHRNAGRIARVTMEYKSSGTINTTATTGTKVGPQFKRTFPAVQEYVRTFLSHNVVKANEKFFEEPAILFADEAFFKIFTFKIISGDAGSALNAPDKIVLTQSMAKKYFGDQNPINKTVTTGGRDLIVSAICEDVPANSQIKFDFVTQFTNLGNGVKEEIWWTANWITYLLLRDAQSIVPLEQQINHYMQTAAVQEETGMSGDNYLKYHLEPLTQVHLHSSLAGFEPNGKLRYIIIFGIIAVLILVVAGANYTNLSTAQSVNRSGEIGMRKVMGASKSQVFIQFISESFLIAMVAASIAFLLSVLSIPYFNSVTGKSFTYRVLIQPVPIAFLLAFTFFTGILSGIYPALILSGTRTLGVLKQAFSFTGGSSVLRKSLIIIQFAISVFMISYTIVIMQQMHYLQTKNLGYQKDHLLVLPIGGNMLARFESIKKSFAQVRGIESITAAYETPEFVEWGDGVTAIDEKGKHDISLKAMPVDLDFTSTLKMQMAAGRDFIESDFALMDTVNNSANYQQPYLINESLAKEIGWTADQAIGRKIENRAMGPIVGVVKDFHFSSLHEPIGPLLLFLGRNFSRSFIIRVDANDVKGTIRRLETTWNQQVPDRPFNYHFLDDDYNKLYISEQRSTILFALAAGLAILLACLGLFGLAAFTTVQRTKEIGIRRVLGARVSNITLMLAKNFLQLVGIAIMIALPLAWWASNVWLQDFAFRISISITVFLASAIVTVLIAFSTVGYHAVKAAWTNPIKNLRSE